MKKVIAWSVLSILNIVISYKAGELLGEKLAESINCLIAKD